MTEAVDSGLSGTTDSGTSTSPDTTTAPEQSTTNPAWDPFLAELPEYFHPKAKEHFKTWDEGYNKLQSERDSLQKKYEPYEPYVGVQPEAINYALGLLNQINSDPMKVYQALLEHVKSQGLLKDETTPDPNTENLEEDPRYSDLDKRTQALDQRTQQFEEYLQQQAYNQQVSTYEAEVDKQVQAVIDKYGAAVDTEDLMQRIYVQVQQGKPFDAEAAFNEQKTVFQRLYAKQGQTLRPAPTVIPTTGTPAPSGEVKPEEMNEDQRKAYFKHLLDLANAGG